MQPAVTSPPLSNVSQISQLPGLTSTATSTVCENQASNTSLSCGLESYGFDSYLIIQIFNKTPVHCHLSCLADWNCMSFQVQLNGSRYCNLFSTSVSGNVELSLGSGYFSYDKSCPNYLLGPCASPTSTAQLSSTVITAPSYLATIPPSRISSACACLLTSPTASTSSDKLSTTLK
ncbi:uncharacterized protein LY89DRAFT_275990 [Mollisia scopiformis]|uniref:Apple domain-containing protein n=1 Tax=Mollisia scopiformis TaxID=149040 RepID=A0A132BBB6_MOLSC|nr:uncharacterized protein LY89DRAFT_275990 [Mollisia scopiformis]KUJ09705.1 hypothetical protein LY89DRAFT_275990 [Mollisia scopiformis]